MADPAAAQAEAKGTGAVTLATAEDAGLARKARRVALDGAGHAAGSTSTRSGRRASLPQPVMEQVQRLAHERSLATDMLTVLEVTGGATYRAASKALDGQRKVVVVVDRNAMTGERHKPFIRVLVTHILDDRIVRVEETERR